MAEDLVKHLTATLKMENLDDFINYVNEDKAKQELADIVQGCNAVKNDQIQVARLRTAWIVAKAAIVESGVKEEELDSPLLASQSQQLEQAWKLRYPFEIDIYLTPADSLLGRVYREFKKRQPTVLSIAKVKSVLMDKKPRDDRVVSLPAGVTLRFDEEDSLVIRSAMEYYFQLRVLMYAWSYCGNFVTSSAGQVADSLFLRLDECIRYADMSLRHCMEFGKARKDWLQERDELTRGHFATNVRRGMRGDLALKQALSDTHLDWRNPGRASSPDKGAENKRQRVASPPRGAPSASKAKTVSTLPGGQKVCKAWNDGRGCSIKGCTNAHVCDAIDAATGKACAKQHTRLSHR